MSFEYKSIYLDDKIENRRVIDIFEPEEVTREAAIFFIHGGGWGGGSRDSYHELMRAANQDGYICACTGYRLVDGKGIDLLSQITDVRHGYDCFVSYLKRRKRPLKIFVTGSSAGSHLTELLGFADPGECGESLEFKGRGFENEWVKPTGLIPVCAPSTFVPWEYIFPSIIDAMIKAAGKPFEEDPDLYRRLSPDNYLKKGMPPVFFICAGREHMFPVQMIADFVEKIKNKGNLAEYKIYDDAWHGFLYHLDNHKQLKAFGDILDFIARITN